MTRALIVFLCVAAGVSATPTAATETVSFRLPNPGGQAMEVRDFGSRYLLLVYQGIP